MGDVMTHGMPYDGLQVAIEEEDEERAGRRWYADRSRLW